MPMDAPGKWSALGTPVVGVVPHPALTGPDVWYPSLGPDTPQTWIQIPAPWLITSDPGDLTSPI